MPAEVRNIKRHGDEDPFPLSMEYALLDGRSIITKYLGDGKYRADQLGQTVTVTATGKTPNFNTAVRLEQAPLTIFPPQFGLFFYDQDITLPAERPFLVQAHFHSAEIVRTVVVFDANGRHEVSVQNF